MRWTRKHNPLDFIKSVSSPIPKAYDWNGDGLVDLVLGCIGQEVLWYECQPDGSVSNKVSGENPLAGPPLPSTSSSDSNYAAVPRFVYRDGPEGGLDLMVSFGT